MGCFCLNKLISKRKNFQFFGRREGTAMKKIILIMVMILLPVQGNALEFDVWKTGEAKNKVIDTAKREKIELNTHAKVVRGGSVASNEIHYSSYLFKEEAKVSLVFTKKSNVLYGIIIDWRDLETTERGEALYEKIENTLGEKYIKDEEVAGKGSIRNNKEIFKDCTTTTTKYKGGISSTLFRCNEKRFISVRYIDNKLEQQNVFEEKNAVKERNGDSGKF
ncbi:MAG: hypothetical protein D3917_04840 [Candidatus Electrothrix sp. AX5]|nr:hypothetical protein [Candidatus Electrothrix sp. AX5]